MLCLLVKFKRLEQAKTTKGDNYPLGTSHLVEILSFRNTRYLAPNLVFQIQDVKNLVSQNFCFETLSISIEIQGFGSKY